MVENHQPDLLIYMQHLREQSMSAVCGSKLLVTASGVFVHGHWGQIAQEDGCLWPRSDR